MTLTVRSVVACDAGRRVDDARDDGGTGRPVLRLHHLRGRQGRTGEFTPLRKLTHSQTGIPPLKAGHSAGTSKNAQHVTHHHNPFKSPRPSSTPQRSPSRIRSIPSLTSGWVGLGVCQVTSKAALATAVWVGLVQNILSKSIKYALFDPTKEMAYIPLGTVSQKPPPQKASSRWPIRREWVCGW
jgi:hypothetical protein